MNHDEYVRFLKDTAISQAKKGVLKIIFSKLPFLTWGPLGSLVGLAVGKVLEIAVNQTEMGAFFYFTDLRVSRQGRDYQEALEENMEAQKNGTDQDKAKAEEKLKNSFRELVKITN